MKSLPKFSLILQSATEISALWFWLTPHCILYSKRKKVWGIVKIDCKPISWTAIQKRKDFGCKDVIACSTDPYHQVFKYRMGESDAWKPGSLATRTAPVKVSTSIVMSPTVRLDAFPKQSLPRRTAYNAIVGMRKICPSHSNLFWFSGFSKRCTLEHSTICLTLYQ